MQDIDKLSALRRERSLVIIKPDGVVRHLVGEIIGRFERKGLKIVALKMVHPSKTQVGEHYLDDPVWAEESGARTLKSYLDRGIDPGKTALEIGRETRHRLMDYLGAGPVVVMVLEGAHVIETVRKMRGATSPLNAEPGTIGFDFTVESYELADAGDWAVRNIIHGSDSTDNAQREVGVWFGTDEIMDYETAQERIIYSKDWHRSRD